MKTILLIDGNAIMHRAFHALPPMTNQDGIPTNMTHGFFMIIHKIISDFRPNYIAVCFDTPKKTFRQELLAAYQAQRPPSPDEFKIQIPYIMKLLDASGMVRVERDGFEADDVIGSLTTTFKKQNARILILTGDKDIMQLVDENTSVISPQHTINAIKLYTPEEVQNRLQVLPIQIPDYKALAGDPSDNYKGVPGVGPKTAARLIQQYGTVEDLLNKISTVKDDKLRAKLEAHRDDIVLTKKIATIVKDLDFSNSLDHYSFTSFNPKMKDELMKLQLFSVMKRFFPQETPVKQKKAEPKKEKEPQLGLF